MCMADYGDCTTVASSSAHRTARKDHRCGECCRIIKAGERYRYETCVTNDHYVCTAKTCSHCQVAQTWLADNCGGYLFDAVIVDLKEHIREYPAIGYGLARVVRGAERKWQRFDGGGLMAVPAMPRSIESVVV